MGHPLTEGLQTLGQAVIADNLATATATALYIKLSWKALEDFEFSELISEAPSVLIAPILLCVE